MKRMLRWTYGATLAIVLLFMVHGEQLEAAETDTNAVVELTDEERIYIEEHPHIILGATDSAAPIASFSKDGELEGITKSVTDYMSQILGVTFESVPYYNIDDAARVVDEKTVDMIMIPKNYAKTKFPEVQLSTPFLTASTVMIYRENLKLDELEDKICAVVEGDKVPEGVSEDQVLLCESRLETIEAVHEGKADYAYGNEFSVAYYNGLRDYHNIVTVPIKQTNREYCFGLVSSDPELLSVINKAISQISAGDMQTLILEACVVPDKPISLAEVITQFAVPLIFAAAVLLVIMAAVVFYIIRMNGQLKLQNMRLFTIAEVSGDLLFEYNIKNEELFLSKQFRERFHIEDGYGKCTISDIIPIDEVIQRKITGEEVVLPNGEAYKAVYSYVQGNDTKPLFLVGKLLDISQEKAEMEVLSNKAKYDGLTHVLNSAECKEASEQYLETLESEQKDAMLIIDIDYFKHINDTYGHYEGDQILMRTAETLKRSFRSQDIVGRLGGDEFLVYMRSVTDEESVRVRCESLLRRLRFSLERDGEKEQTSVSIGGYMILQPESFETVYQKADKALYRAKEKGRNGYCI